MSWAVRQLGRLFENPPMRRMPKPAKRFWSAFSKCGVWPSPATAMNVPPTVSDDGWRFRGLMVAAPGDGRTPAIRFADFENTAWKDSWVEAANYIHFDGRRESLKAGMF
jgi:hypothetical protein